MLHVRDINVYSLKHINVLLISLAAIVFVFFCLCVSDGCEDNFIYNNKSSLWTNHPALCGLCVFLDAWHSQASIFCWGPGWMWAAQIGPTRTIITGCKQHKHRLLCPLCLLPCFSNSFHSPFSFRLLETLPVCVYPLFWVQPSILGAVAPSPWQMVSVSRGRLENQRCNSFFLLHHPSLSPQSNFSVFPLRGP